jgi:hypothetical protein
MARPDITELGESLLSGKIERVRKQEKRAKKDQRKALLMGLGLQLGAGVAKSFFDDKVKDWATNESVFAARAKHNTALMSAERTVARQKEIDKFEGNGVDYFYTTKVRPRIESMADQYFRDQGIDRPSEKQLESFYHGEGYKIAEKMYGAHEKARAAIPMLGTAQERDAYLASVDKRPDSMFEIIGAKIRGKSKEDYQREYLRSLELSPYAQSAKIINEAENVLLSTGDDFAAENYVKYKDKLAKVETNVFKVTARDEQLPSDERPFRSFKVTREASDGTKKTDYEFPTEEDRRLFEAYKESKTETKQETFIHKGVEMYRDVTKTVDPTGNTVIESSGAKFVNEADQAKYGSLAGFWPVTETAESLEDINGITFKVTTTMVSDQAGGSTKTIKVDKPADFQRLPKEDLDEFQSRISPYFGEENKAALEEYTDTLDDKIRFGGEDNSGFQLVLDATAKRTRQLETEYQVDLSRVTGQAFANRAIKEIDIGTFWDSWEGGDPSAHLKPVINSGVEVIVAIAESNEAVISKKDFEALMGAGQKHYEEIKSMTPEEVQKLVGRLDAVKASGNMTWLRYLEKETYNASALAGEGSFYSFLKKFSQTRG